MANAKAKAKAKAKDLAGIAVGLHAPAVDPGLDVLGGSNPRDVVRLVWQRIGYPSSGRE